MVHSLYPQEYQKIVSGERDEDRALVAVLSQPEFQSQVANKIDIKKSNKPVMYGGRSLLLCN